MIVCVERKFDVVVYRGIFFIAVVAMADQSIIKHP